MERPITQAFTATLEKEPGLKLGLTIEPSHSHSYLTVLDLPGAPSLCSKYNDAFPGVAIKPRDVIVQVNGTSGSDEMIDALQAFLKGEAKKATVCIERK